MDDESPGPLVWGVFFMFFHSSLLPLPHSCFAWGKLFLLSLPCTFAFCVGRVYFIIFLPLRWFFFIFYFINIFIYHIKVIILYMFYMPAMFYTGSGLPYRVIVGESKGGSLTKAIHERLG